MSENRKIAWHKWELNKHLESLKEELRSFNDEKIDEINTKIYFIKNFYSNYFEWETSKKNEIDNLVNELENHKNSFIENQTKIEKYYKELLEWDDENYSKKEDIEKSLDEIKNYKKELLEWTEWDKSIKEKINNSFVEIKDYYSNIYWIEEEKNETWEIIKEWKQGFKEKLDNLYKTNDTKYKELEEKIKSLIWGATSAWLSSAYREMKKSFTSPNVFWNIIFICSISYIIYIWKDLKVSGTFQETVLNIIAHFPVILPLIWLAYFSTKQQSQNKRLQQEYAHKESLAKSFEWYKKQIDNLGEDEKSEEIKKVLMENIVKMTWENPSKTLDWKHWTTLWDYMIEKNKKDKSESL